MEDTEQQKVDARPRPAALRLKHQFPLPLPLPPPRPPALLGYEQPPFFEITHYENTIFGHVRYANDRVQWNSTIIDTHLLRRIYNGVTIDEPTKRGSPEAPRIAIMYALEEEKWHINYD
jgi:hypothetical protein